MSVHDHRIVHDHPIEEEGILLALGLNRAMESFPNVVDWRKAYRDAGAECAQSTSPYEQAKGADFEKIADMLGDDHPPSDPVAKAIFKAASDALSAYRSCPSYTGCLKGTMARYVWENGDVICKPNPDTYMAIDPRFIDAQEHDEISIDLTQDIACMKKVIGKLPEDCKTLLSLTL